MKYLIVENKFEKTLCSNFHISFKECLKFLWRKLTYCSDHGFDYTYSIYENIWKSFSVEDIKQKIIEIFSESKRFNIYNGLNYNTKIYYRTLCYGQTSPGTKNIALNQNIISESFQKRYSKKNLVDGVKNSNITLAECPKLEAYSGKPFIAINFNKYYLIRQFIIYRTDEIG